MLSRFQHPMSAISIRDDVKFILVKLQVDAARTPGVEQRNVLFLGSLNE